MQPSLALLAACALSSIGALAVPDLAAKAVSKLASCSMAQSGKRWISTPTPKPRAGSGGFQVPDLAGPAIEAAIRVSRWKARREGTRRIPADIHAGLSSHFSTATLKTVRWVSLERELRDVAFREECLAGTGALTLQDTVIFSSEKAAADLRLWAHELMHVKQYARLGVDGFAREYAKNPRRLEDQAEARALEIAS